jgi:hypothetical protein
MASRPFPEVFVESSHERGSFADAMIGAVDLSGFSGVCP